MEKRKRNKTARSKGADVFVIVLGAFLLLWSCGGVCLNLLGDVTDARDITASRTKPGRQDEAGDGKNRRFSVSYTYTVDGVDYDGLDTGVRGEWLGPRYDGTVHYLPFAPRISSMYAEDAVSAGMLIPLGLVLALILLGAVPQKQTKRKSSKKSGALPGDAVGEALKSNQPVTLAWLMEHAEGYDERLEEYFQKGWDEGDPSWECACGKWNTGNFCERCGKPRPR